MTRIVSLAAAAALAAGLILPQHATGQVVERSYRNASDVTAAPAGNGYLGVQIEDGFVNNSTESDPSRFHWGARVASVVPDSPAAKAGLVPGDLILRVNERDVRRASDLTAAIGALGVDAKVALLVLREGREEKLSAQLAKRPDPGAFAAPPSGASAFAGPPGGLMAPPSLRADPFAQMERNFQRMQEQMLRMEEEFGRLRGGAPGGAPMLRGFSSSQSTLVTSSDSRTGLMLQSLTPQLAAFFGAGDAGGVLVGSVEEGSPGAAAGLRAGDVIVGVGGESVDNPAHAQALAAEGAAAGVELRILREKQESTVTLGPTAGPS